jgi:hypothetical protein
VLTVTVIIGMLLSAMVVIVPLLVKAPLQMQSQVDNVNTAAIALYKMRRDFAEGDTNGVMGCTTAPVVCSTEPAKPVGVQALVVATAEDATGAFKIDPLGNPQWQGFHVYWLVPDASGVSYDLMRAWEPASIWTSGLTVPTGVSPAVAATAVTAAMAISPPPVLTNYISSMSLGTSGASSTINFELVAGTSSGADQTQTNFQSDTYARN